MSVCPSVRLSLQISVTTEPIAFHSLGNVPTGPVAVLGYFLGGWDTPNPPKNEIIPPPRIFFYLRLVVEWGHLQRYLIFFKLITSWGKASRG